MIQDSEEYIALFPYQEILSGIKSSLLIHEGVIKLTSEPGLGKTTLCHQLSKELIDETQRVIFFETPPKSPDDIEASISQTFDLGTENTFTRLLLQKLNEDAERPITLILIIDDAEQMDNLTLQAIRMLTNIQNDEKALVKVVLSASPSLNQTVTSRENRALLQSIAQSFVVKPLSFDESEEFSREFMMQHGLEKLLLEQQGMKLLHKLTEGKPGALMEFWQKLADSRENLPASLTKPLVRRNIKVKQNRSKFGLTSSLSMNSALLGGTLLLIVLVGTFLLSPFSDQEQNFERTPSLLPPSTESISSNTDTNFDTSQQDVSLDTVVTNEAVSAMDNRGEEIVEVSGQLGEVSSREEVGSEVQRLTDQTEINITTDSLGAEQTIELVQGLPPLATEELAVTGVSEEALSVESNDVPTSRIAQPAILNNNAITASSLPTTETDKTLDEVAVEELLTKWLNSWQQKNTNIYFSYYDENFIPAYHSTLSLWREDRIEKINRANDITLGFENVEIISRSETQLTVRFLQSYHTPTYADETLKELMINVNEGSWRILSERNLTVTRLF